MKSRFAIVTPAKNEAENIPNLVKGMAEQAKKPDLWVFINDGSTDETVSIFENEKLKYADVFKNIEIKLVHYQDDEIAYALGPKYSRIIRFGLDKVFSEEGKNKYDFVGILDSDVVPEIHYFENLLKKFVENPKLGIASAGKQNENNGKTIITSYVNKSFAPSGFRVWRRECLDETDYTISVSQDSVSAAKAIMLGWKVQSFPDLEVSLRQMGANFGYEYYGKSAYMLHIPFIYVLAGAGRLYLLGKKGDAKQYVRGYKEASKNSVSRIEDPLVIKYFKNRIYYKMIGK